MSSFDERLARMVRIFRGEETYGDETTPYKQAEAFYKASLRDDVIKRVTTKAQETLAKRPDQAPVDLLISLAGFSPMTSIMSCLCLSPARLLLITSPAVEAQINVIGEYLIGHGHLQYAQFQSRSCDPVDAMSIYRIVKEAINELRRTLGRRPHVVIDITGGKKVMSATAAFGAWQFDTPLCYIDTLRYSPELRRPEPGTEVLCWIDNPSTVFGDQKVAAGEDVFNSGAFENAAARFKHLAERIASPHRVRFRALLAELYHAWAGLDLEHLPELIDEIRAMLRDHRVGLDHVRVDQLGHQLDFLSALAHEERRDALLLCFHLLGKHYSALGRRDFAALLFYRTAEGVMTDHLERSYDGFKSRPTNFEALGGDLDKLASDYRETCEQIFPHSGAAELPGALGFMNSAVLLYCLPNDKLLREAHIRDVKALTRLHQLSEVRNRSILAHGFQPVTAERLRELENLAQRLLSALWRLHHPDEDLQARIHQLTFIKLGEAD